jgi:chemotaxis protein methyltransferase CheR
MVVHDFFGGNLANIDCGLLATDISLAALQEAQAGIYAAARLKDLPARHRNLWFTKLGEDRYALSPEIKQMVMFKRFNLMSDEFPFKGQFDVVFCRNVMIYFDQATRDKLVANIHRFVKPGGYFFIGHSESLPRQTCPFRYIGPAIYRKDAD